tara:strand:+ start:269 stop:514 length:246 start_codon:yes stop_codon:yes gene_type:complete
MEIQSVIIPKKNYTYEEAEKKVEKLGYRPTYRGKNVKEYNAGQTTNFYRFRQKPPSRFDKDSFRTKRINDIYLVVGKLKEK